MKYNKLTKIASQFYKLSAGDHSKSWRGDSEILEGPTYERGGFGGFLDAHEKAMSKFRKAQHEKDMTEWERQDALERERVLAERKKQLEDAAEKMSLPLSEKPKEITIRGNVMKKRYAVKEGSVQCVNCVLIDSYLRHDPSFKIVPLSDNWSITFVTTKDGEPYDMQKITKDGQEEIPSSGPENTEFLR